LRQDFYHITSVLLTLPSGGKGRLFIAKDFDAPLPEEIHAAFEGRT
jgi:hypothetical protein